MRINQSVAVPEHFIWVARQRTMAKNIYADHNKTIWKMNIYIFNEITEDRLDVHEALAKKVTNVFIDWCC